MASEELCILRSRLFPGWETAETSHGHILRLKETLRLEVPERRALEAGLFKDVQISPDELVSKEVA